MSTRPFEISVIVCTHNPRRDFLERTLEGLKRQTVPSDQWELLIIDNASMPAVGEVADISWHSGARIVREDQLGLTAARLRGIKEITADLLVFVDDDNVLCRDYLEQAVAIHQRLPMLGVFGPASIAPEYEESPKADLLPYVNMLALRESTEPHWSNDPTDRHAPWGAGMVLVRCVAEQVVAGLEADGRKLSLGRCGTSLNSCEDDEFAWIASAMGMGNGIFPELKITHLIPRGRVQREYLLRIKEGHEYSRTMLWFFHDRPRHVSPPPVNGMDLLKSALLLRSRSFLKQAVRFARQMTWSKTEKAFIEAGYRGISRALQDIEALSSDSNASPVDPSPTGLRKSLAAAHKAAEANR